MDRSNFQLPKSDCHLNASGYGLNCRYRWQSLRPPLAWGAPSPKSDCHPPPSHASVLWSSTRRQFHFSILGEDSSEIKKGYIFRLIKL